MSQSATLFRITPEKFDLVKKTNGKKVDPGKLSEESSTYHGSFMALEFILLKGKDESTSRLIKEIFNPQNCIGCEDMSRVNLDTITEEELQHRIDSVLFITPENVKEINDILRSVTEYEIDRNYNWRELNQNDIYPWCWHDDNSADQAFNKRHILGDYKELKIFFQRAVNCNNYIMTYVG
jgi:hypothetical protein